VAVDTIRQTASQSINIVVTNASEPTTMHVSAIDMWSAKTGRDHFVCTKVAVVDNSTPSPQPVAGATVLVTTTLPKGGSTSQTAATGPDGTATLFVRSPFAGTFTSTVTDVTDSLTYDPSANLETTDSCSVP